jgi:FtsP/CotA-like multicopper oxidase with cupredoxin domain
MRFPVALFVLLIAGCSHAQTAVAPPADVFPSVPEVRAVAGVATVDLHAVLDPATGLPTLSYQSIPGDIPTIRVHPGDTIALTLHNDMPPIGSAPNAINIHFHGLQVSPREGEDDSISMLAHRGDVLHYHVHVPRDHEPGLYWYHPHSHGETFREVSAGISGAIVVEGMQEHLPALAAMRERIVILRDVPTDGKIVDDDMPMNGMPMNVMPQANVARPRQAENASNPCRNEKGMWTTMNGQPLGAIGIAAGERQFFRVVNASAGRYYDLSVDGSPLQVVAYDGIPLDALPGNPTSRTVGHIVIPPAGRAEFVVTGTGKPSVLRSACFDSGKTGDPDPAAIIANLVPSGSAPDAAKLGGGAAVAATLPGHDALAVGKPLPNNFFAKPFPAPAAHRTVRFTEDSNGFYFDGKAFDMDGPPTIVARSGTVERWTLVNTTDEVHDFHIHQVHFVVDSVRGRPPKEREWLDTVNLEPHTTTDVTIDFRNPVVRGTFMYHCHILDHEDQGMMAKIQVL